MLAAVLAALTGCSGGGSAPGEDGGRPDGATVVEAGPAPDGGWYGDGAPSADGAPQGDASLVGCITTPCDQREPRSCAAPGDICVLDDAVPACVEMAGMGAPGDYCDATADCAPGFACFLAHGEGRCASPCCPSDVETCGAGERCGAPGVLVDGTATQFYRCTGPRPCDVFAPQEVCEDTEGCYIVDPDGTTDCRPAGAGESGAPCVEQSDCMPGFFCGGLTAPTCVRICELRASSGDRACPPDEGSCRAYSHSPEGTGLCTPT